MEKQSKHTPGPWYYDATWGLIHDARKTARTPHESAAEICAIHAGRTGSKDETTANARLIASAPELLEALARIATVPKAGEPGYRPLDSRDAIGFITIARTAIDKATGEGE